MNKTGELLQSHYASRYGTPIDDKEALETLNRAFKDLIPVSHFSKENEDGIAEYYRLIKARDLPAFEWMLESFHVVSKKEKSKQNLRYVIGILRSWMKNGFGNIPSEEEEEVFDYFEEVIQQDATTQTRILLQTLMGKFGGIRMMRIIGQLDRNVDISLLLAKVLEEELEQRYIKKETV